MKARFLTAAAVIATLVAAPALAQPDDQRDHGQGGPHGGGGGGAPHEMGGAPHGGGGGGGGPHGGGGGMMGQRHEGGPMGGGGGGGRPMTAGPMHEEHQRGPAAREQYQGGPGARGEFQRGPTGREEHQRGPGAREEFQRGPTGREHYQGGAGARQEFQRGPAGREEQRGWNGPGRNRNAAIQPGRPLNRAAVQAGWAARHGGPSRAGPVIPRGSVTARGGRFTFEGRTFNRVRAPRFYYPSGYSYRRWWVGARLPWLFLTPSYFFTDYTLFGFPPPPFGEEWVRYGPDLLLVDLYTGEIVYVIYGAFW